MNEFFFVGSRQAIGLPNPRLSGIQTGTQRAAQGLRPPSTRANTAASSSTDGLRGPTGISQYNNAMHAMNMLYFHGFLFESFMCHVSAFSLSYKSCNKDVPSEETVFNQS